MLYKKHKKWLNGRIILTATLTFFIVSIASLILSAPVYAVTIPVNCPDGYTVNFPHSPTQEEINQKCQDHQTGAPGADDIEADSGSGTGTGEIPRADFDTLCKNGLQGTDEDPCPIVGTTIKYINALSGIVGVVVVIMIIIGGIQYSSAGSDPQKIASAKSKIVNALLALLVFIFLYAFLQWVVPGGVF